MLSRYSSPVNGSVVLALLSSIGSHYSSLGVFVRPILPPRSAPIKRARRAGRLRSQPVVPLGDAFASANPNGLPSESLQIAHRVARMDHGPAEGPDPIDRAGEVVDLEIRQREGVPGAAASGVNADREGIGWRLPALAFALDASFEREAEQLRPESAGPLGVIRGELEQREHGAHRETISPGRAARCGALVRLAFRGAGDARDPARRPLGRSGEPPSRIAATPKAGWVLAM